MKMKYWVGIAIFIAWGVFVALLVTALLGGQNRDDPATNTSQTNTTTQTNLLTAESVGKHSSTSDCWLIISGKVYDVTSYLYAHPGGAGTISPYCGKDGTQAFATKDIGRSHSSYAASLLGNYYVGDLNGKVAGSVVGKRVNQSQSNVPPGNGYDDSEYETDYSG